MILSTLKLRIAQNKSLLIAAFISLALHTFLLSGYSISLPADFENINAINVRLIKAMPEKKPVTPNAVDNQPAPAPPQRSKPNHQNKPVQKPETPVMPISATEEINHQTLPDQANNTDAPLESDYDRLVAESANNALAIESAESANTHITTAYPYVHTEFEVTRGDDSGSLGNTQITFNMNPRNNTYQLTSLTEAKGLASLFLSKLEQYSEGNVDEKGLKPNYYAYQYGNNSEKNQYARMSWTDGLIEMTSKKGKKSETLPAGTQDFLSFMYQFMFTPPLNSMQITMTNGKYLRTYTYSFEGEETISTKLGDLKTLHLLKSGDNLEKTEIWLALDYQNIPVKIRKTEKDGRVIEQTVTAISTIRPE